MQLPAAVPRADDDTTRALETTPFRLILMLTDIERPASLLSSVTQAARVLEFREKTRVICRNPRENGNLLA